MTAIYTNVSCGVGQLFDLRPDPTQIIHSVYRNHCTYMENRIIQVDGKDVYATISLDKHPLLEGQHCHEYPIMIFSDNDNRQYGIRLAAEIQNYKLGEIFETPSVRNPNSGNNIRCWMWVVDRKAIENYLQKHGTIKAKVETIVKKAYEAVRYSNPF